MPQEYLNRIIQGDCLEVMKKLPDGCVDLVVTSPPYWNLRDYGVRGQLGMEDTFQKYVEKLCGLFDEILRVLKNSGVCFVNLGDTYGTGSGAGSRKGAKQASVKQCNENGKSPVAGFEKSLLMIPERFAVEMCNRGWTLRNKVIWYKKNAMPSSVVDRLSNKYELVYFFTKSPRYYFDLDSIRVPFETDGSDKRPMCQRRVREMGYNTKFGTKQRKMEEDARRFGKRRPPGNEYERNPKGKNPGDVWSLTLQPHKEAHIAMFPEKLIEPMILAGCPPGGG